MLLLDPKVLEDSVSSISRKFCYTHISQVYVKACSSFRSTYNSNSNSCTVGAQWFVCVKDGKNSVISHVDAVLAIYMYNYMRWPLFHPIGHSKYRLV